MLQSIQHLPFWIGLVRWIQRWRRRRVPVVLQLSAVECGAACLAMILGFYGRRTALGLCRERCAAGRDGVSAFTIVQAARSFGLTVRAVALQDPTFSASQLPAIIHWQFNHFVVVERWTPEWVDLVDPARGRRQVSAAAFNAGFTGVAILCAPSAASERNPARPASAWSLLLRYVRDVPGLIGQLMLASALLQAAGLALPLLISVLAGQLGTPNLAVLLNQSAMGIGMILGIRFVVHYLRSLVLIKLQMRFDLTIMQQFLRHMLALPYDFFIQRSSSDLMMRLNSNRAIYEMLTTESLGMVLDGALMVVYWAIIASIDLGFLGLVGAIGAFHAVMALLLHQQVALQTHHELTAQAQAQHYLEESLHAIATIKATGSEAQVFERWRRLQGQHVCASINRRRTSARMEAALGVMPLLTPLLLLWFGFQAVLDGSMALGTMVSLSIIGMLALAPITTIIRQIQRLRCLGAYLDRIQDVLTATPIPEGGETPQLSGALTLKGVHFRYTPTGQPTLQDISFHIDAGQKVALVGRSGSGKSTLARMVIGLHQPTSGEIAFDGIDSRRIDQSYLRQQNGVVLQDIHVFNGSIRENIGFNHPDVRFEELVAAARTAGIHDEIMQMPLAYETRIGAGGYGISGGQRQRIALARALVHRPTLLLLDEASSNLDTTTERSVDAHLNALTCTRIIITHRMKSIRDADLIVVLDAGRIVEQGTHADLLASNGLYAQLVAEQG